MKKVLFTLLFIIPFAVQANCLLAINGQVYCGAGACQQDNSGMVSCSIYKDGGAEVNGQGRVVCGKGECKTGSTGSVLCSVEQDGGAALNQGGQVKCYGGCEPGSESMCESISGL